MKWLAVRLRTVAPPQPSCLRLEPDAYVWHLSLDQVESNTGRVVGRVIRRAEDAGSSTFVFDDGNVLYSKLRPYLNKVLCPDGVGISTTEMIPLRPNPRVLCRRFLWYYLRSDAFVRFASRAVAGVKMPRVIMDKFWAHELPLPPPSEQRRIVEILDQADALRKKRAEADAKAARILPALFYKMFGDPVANPKALPKKKLGDLIKVKSGDFLPAKDMDATGPYPVYGGNGINGHHSEYMFEHPVIVIGRVGVYCGAVHYSEPRCWVTDNALYVSEHSDELRPRYLAEALRVANLNQYAGRAGQPLVSGSRIYPVEILVPSREDQDAFGRCVAALEHVERLEDSTRGGIETTFSILLHHAFTGELTAKWREAHRDQLEVEMQEQMAALEKAKGGQPTRGRRRRVTK